MKFYFCIYEVNTNNFILFTAYQMDEEYYGMMKKFTKFCTLWLHDISSDPFRRTTRLHPGPSKWTITCTLTVSEPVTLQKWVVFFFF